MLKIDSNMTIKMSRGEDAKFPLFLNQGNSITPIRYVMQGDKVNILSHSNKLNIKIDNSKWKGFPFGEYLFIYKDNNWYLKNNLVKLEDYGINIDTNTSLKNNDFIKLEYIENDGCEIYFKIFKIHETCPFFVKTFTSNDQWTGKFNNEEPVGDIKIELLHSDPLVFEGATLDEVEAGEYRYQITGKLLDPTVSQERGKLTYVNEVLTNKLKLYIIDDDYEARLWSDVRKR